MTKIRLEAFGRDGQVYVHLYAPFTFDGAGGLVDVAFGFGASGDSDMPEWFAARGRQFLAEHQGKNRFQVGAAFDLVLSSLERQLVRAGGQRAFRRLVSMAREETRREFSLDVVVEAEPPRPHAQA